MFLSPGRCNVVIDGQWGSTGKGKLCAWLALNSDLQIAICDFQSNAGHTIVYHGEKHVVHQVPASFVNLDCTLAIGPAASITVDLLLDEIERLNSFKVADRLIIHPNACIILPEHVQREQGSVKRYASTMKGCGAALADKVMRKAVLAKDVPSMQPYLGDTTNLVHNFMRSRCTVLAESAQGFDLSLNFGHEYPYTTSRDVTTSSILSNMGVPPRMVGNVWGCLRTYPIRVGHVVEGGELVGDSGGYYPDQRELSWPDLEKSSGAQTPLQELTTVTKRVRRIFSWSDYQFEKFLRVCDPSHLFLNFVNHIDARAYQMRTKSQLPPKVLNEVERIRHTMNAETPATLSIPCVSLLGTGPDNEDMVIL